MQPSSTAPVRALVLLCLAAAGWAFTFGVGSQTATLWLNDAAAGDTLIGLNQSVYHLGIALAAPFVPRLLRRLGVGCAVGGMGLFALFTALFPWGGTPAGCLTLRLLQGVGGALSLVPLEAFLSRTSRPEHCGRNFGLYAVALTLGGAVGIVGGAHLYRAGSALPFLLAGATAAASGLVLLLGLPRIPEPAEQPRPGQAPLNLGRNFLSYATAWCQGFLEAGMLGFLLLYLLGRGLSQDSAGTMMGAAMAGVILFQVPVAWLADRLGKTPVLLGCYGVALLGLLFVPLCGPGVWLGVWLFLFGGCSGAFYPLGLALLGERLPADNLARAYACSMTMECLGSITGPVCMGKARAWYGERGLFAAGGAAVVLALVSWLAVRLVAGRYNGWVSSEEPEAGEGAFFTPKGLDSRARG